MSEVESYWVSAAFVAVTTQEPAAVGVSAVPLTEQSPDTFVKETDPEPEPPVVVRVSVAPYVAVVLVMFNAACAARLISKLRDTAFAAK